MLYSAFIFGILGSFHCIGMCGPIAFMLPVSRDDQAKKFLQVMLYHLGRLVAYSIIGLAFGLVGKSLNLFGFQQQLSIGVGILMLLMVLLPLFKVKGPNFSNSMSKAISRIRSSLGQALKKKTPDTFFTIGFLNGFLPCGLVYMAVFGAVASGGLLQGSLYMILFGAGTIPLMTTAVYSKGLLNRIPQRKVRRMVPVFVAVVGILFILRGSGLGIPYISPGPEVEMVSAEASCH